MKHLLVISLLVVSLIYTFISCRPKTDNTVNPADGNFPPEIASIIITKCATEGCHKTANIGNNFLALDTWEHLFQGDGQGAVVVPYCTKYSYLLYRVNTDTTLGTVVPPSQPPTIDRSKPAVPLSKSEYLTLSNWIAKGAPDKYGNIPFASDPDTRQKLYLTEQGCDLVSVIDAKSMLIMRYIPVGIYPQITESPHSVCVSSDGMSAYVCFFASGYVQKIDTRTDTVVASVNIGSFLPGGTGSWGIITGTPDVDSGVAVTDWEPTGAIATVNTKTMKLDGKYRQGMDLVYPHGIASNPTWDTLYISEQYGNVIYKFFPSALKLGDPFYKKISIDGKPITETDTNGTLPDPHEIEMSPDNSKYFVACQGTNDVRVMDAYADTLIKIIPVGTFPQEFAISGNPATPYLFVTCMRDLNNPGYSNGNIGSVYVIDYNTYQVVKVIYGDFALPHDLAVDDRDGLLYIPSTNSNPNGPPQHHATACGGNSGWYTVYKFGPNYFAPVNNYRYQTTVYPYAIGVRFED